MVVDTIEIKIPLNDKREISLKIKGLSKESLFLIDSTEALNNAEAPYQLLEGHLYQYKIESGYHLRVSSGYKDVGGIISVNRFDETIGNISPNTYVGTLGLEVFYKEESERCGILKLEVLSIKANYRDDYRKMLSDITEYCIDLLFQHSSPVTQTVEADFFRDTETLYQRFSFIKSILESEEFDDSINKIVTSPVTKWTESEIDKDTRGVGRFDSRGVKQIANSTHRINLPVNHPLKIHKLQSVPLKIRINYKKETVDTPENRFIKYALSSFLNFVGKVRVVSEPGSRIFMEAESLESHLEEFLGHSIFKEISSLNILILNSPILQRKEGYREVFKSWLMFDLAAKLTWQGGNDIYDIGKRNVAILYEYWLFFVLLGIIKEVFDIEPKKDLIVNTKDQLGLQLKQGKHFPVEGTCVRKSRKFNVQFSYNRTFSGDKIFPDGGSWTRNLRPDYTLSIWPFGLRPENAEEEELIVHLHFDAKYRIDNLKTIFGDATEDSNEELREQHLTEEKDEQDKGNYKRVDLLKMHSYRDAIRRTAGAYVLYPGKDEKFYTRKGFHEILPGLGAFAINPSDSNLGKRQLKDFLEDIVSHFLNKASQREKSDFKRYSIYRNIPNENDVIEESLPEEYGLNRVIPDDTFVIIAYCKDNRHLQWIREKKLYNSRIGKNIGDITLRQTELGARFILLHIDGNPQSSEIYKLKPDGAVTLTREDLINKEYPTYPNVEYYLGFEFAEDAREGFGNQKWDIEKLVSRSKERNIKKPFAVSLSELMKVKFE